MFLNKLKLLTHSRIQIQFRCLQYVPIESKNKIVVGHKMTQIIEHKRIVYAKKNAEKEMRDRVKTKNNLIIKCKDSTYDHYYGQYYDREFDESFYASRAWKNKKDDYFVINAFGPHPAIAEEDSQKTFAELNINENIIKSLEEKFNIKMPTKIQSLSIEKIRSHSIHHLIAAETGTGKTLAYVLPLIEQVIEFNNSENKINRGFNEPLALVMVPTRELAFQLYEVLKKFTNKDLNFRVVLDLNPEMIQSKEILTGSVIDSKLEDSSNIPPDIVITMPNRLRRQLKLQNDYIRSNFLQKLVIDEANLLLDDSNNQYIVEILDRLELNLKPPSEMEYGTLNKNLNTQLLIVSATIPRDMKNILESILDVSNELEVIKTNRINRIMMHVPQHFFRLTNNKKTEQLLAITKASIRDSIMIFSNRTQTAVFVHRLLKENDIKSCLFHSSMNENERDASIQKFLNGECNIISCTDIASRGLDTVHVKHVINYEMPTFIADYVHRIGRVGRFGTTVKDAKVTNLITKSFEIDTVWNIEHSIRKGVDLDNLNANIKRILFNRYTPKDQLNTNSENDSENQQIKQ